jgi:hypothetical protein
VTEGIDVWPPIDLPSGPRSIDIPAPGRSGRSIIGLMVVLVSDDERAVVDLELRVLVRVR